MHVLGRREGSGGGTAGSTEPGESGELGGPPGPTGRLGWFRARDGSRGAPVGIDFDRPHAGLVVGKRGSGKSYTLGVFAEELAATDGVAPVVLDPLDAFAGLEACGFDAREPRVRAGALEPRAWCDLLGLAPAEPAGSLVWRAAGERGRLEGMRSFVDGADVPASTARAARNHLDLAASWGVFDPEGLDPSALADRPTRVVLSGLDPAPSSAVVRTVLAGCYRATLDGTLDRLPWLLLDEAHAFVDGIAEPALRRVLTRGRAPGTSLLLATQRPSALPEVAASQADLVLAHRLTGRADREALERARPAVAGAERGRRPSEPGEALVFDDTSGSVHAVRIRERETPHGGSAPRVSERANHGTDLGERDRPVAVGARRREPVARGAEHGPTVEAAEHREPTATDTGSETDGA